MLLIEMDDLERCRLALLSKYNVPYAKSHKAYNDLVKEWIDIPSGRNHKKVMQWWWYNVFTAVRNGYKGLRVPMNKCKWTNNKCGISYQSVRSIVEYCEQNCYVVRYTGNYFGDVKYETVLEFTDKLLDIVVPRVTKVNFPKAKLDYCVELKERKTGTPKDLEKTEEIETMNGRVEYYNTTLEDADIRFCGEPVPITEYKRIFSNDLFNGGRLYVNGGGVQTLPSKYRKEHLTFGDDKLVELDYSAIHPNILYELEYINDPESLEGFDNFDPYAAEYRGVVDKVAIEKHKNEWGLVKYDPVRNLFKQALVIMLNSADINSARFAITKKIADDRKKPKQDQKYVGLDNIRTGLVMESLSDHNTMINHHFYCDVGMPLQKIDSDIALEVIDLLIINNTTALAYHDSFMCRKPDKALLERAMKDAWKNVIGSNKFCKVEDK